MKILHVTKKYPNALGGDAIVVQNLEKQQKKNGHEVFILTTNCNEIINKKNLIKFGVKSIYQDWDALSFKRFLSTWILIFSIDNIIKKINPDIVHSHSAELGFILSRVCRKYRIPIINQCEGVSFPYPQTSLIRRIVEKFSLKNGKFDKIITVDENSLNAFEKEGIKNVIYVPNSIDLNEFNLNKSIKKKNEFIFVGRVEREKGIEDLINAVQILKNKDFKFKIKLVGDGKDLEDYRKTINSLKLNNYFLFLGRLDHKDTIKNYFESEIFILPSHQEGFPITLLEAWASGLPVIITKVGGISKICTDNKDSLIIEPKNPEQIAEAMQELIKNKKLRKELGKNGRKLVEKKYNWNEINKSLERVYTSTKQFK